MGDKCAKKMKLGKFIAQTLTEIIDGVSTAQEYAKEKGAKLNPQHASWSKEKNSFYIVGTTTGTPDHAPLLSPIEF